MTQPQRIAAALFAVVGLSLPSIGHAQGPSANARDRILVSADWLAEHRGDPGVVLLHVGEKEDYAAEHVPGAVLVDGHYDLSDPDSHGGGGLVLELPEPGYLQGKLRAMGVSDDSRIVVYWGSEWVTPTARVLFTLLWAGLGDRTVLLDGGLDAWKAAGHPVTAEVPTPAPGNVTVRPRSDLVVDAAWVQQHGTASGYHLVDGRAAAFFDGIRADRGKEGHIPGAGSLPWTELIDERLHLRSPAELRALFDKAGVAPGDTVVGYCHIGQYATMVLFAARSLGHEVRLYDGAFQDWAARGLPVESP